MDVGVAEEGNTDTGSEERQDQHSVPLLGIHGSLVGRGAVEDDARFEGGIEFLDYSRASSIMTNSVAELACLWPNTTAPTSAASRRSSGQPRNA